MRQRPNKLLLSNLFLENAADPLRLLLILLRHLRAKKWADLRLSRPSIEILIQSGSLVIIKHISSLRNSSLPPLVGFSLHQPLSF